MTAAPELPSIAPTAPSCLNCGTALPGRYCPTCGQDSHFDLTLGHIAAETLEGLTHFDSSFWRTLRLMLFRPGELTRQFVAGRRKHYMPPVRTYLVISLLYFLVAAGNATSWLSATEEDGSRMQGTQCDEIAHTDPDVLQWFPRAPEVCRRLAQDGGRSLEEAVTHLMPKVMFCVLPLVALVQFWLHRRQQRRYVEALVFVTHFQSFYFVIAGTALGALALLGLAAPAVSATVGPDVKGLVIAWAGVYLFLANRRCYGSSRAKAVWAAVVLGLAYSAFLGLGVVTAELYSLARL